MSNCLWVVVCELFVSLWVCIFLAFCRRRWVANSCGKSDECNDSFSDVWRSVAFVQTHRRLQDSTCKVHLPVLRSLSNNIATFFGSNKSHLWQLSQLLIPSLPGSTPVEGATSKRSGGFVELDLDVGLGLAVISYYKERERERYPVRGIQIEVSKRGIQKRAYRVTIPMCAWLNTFNAK